MRTIEFYENVKTKRLQSLLTKFETLSEQIYLLTLRDYFNSSESLKIKQLNEDYEIDIHLIRMELNKRLWFNNLEK